MTDIVLVGPGRAGLSIAVAATRAGHRVSAVLGRRRESADRAAGILGSRSIGWDETLPPADVVIVAVRDDEIAPVAERLAPLVGRAGAAIHLSGLKGLDVLEAFVERGLPVGSLHPLQTLPSSERGAERLPGAWAAVAASTAGLTRLIEDFARSLGMRPFTVDESRRALYHAGAAAAANYLVAVLGLAAELFEAAGVPFEAGEPLVRAVVDNVYAAGPAAALTGPIARGDRSTVERQLQAVAELAAGAEADFRCFARATARMAGRTDDLAGILE